MATKDDVRKWTKDVEDGKQLTPHQEHYLADLAKTSSGQLGRAAKDALDERERKNK